VGHADRSLKSFLLTLKNQHNCPKFALKAEKKDEAIIYGSACGPNFRDIRVDDKCNANARSFTYRFAHSHANDTRLTRKTSFTGSREFTVKEIEVFEIID
jgi:hypothetical protein